MSVETKYTHISILHAALNPPFFVCGGFVRKHVS